MSGLAVAFLTQGWSPDPGGVETHTRALARGLAARGHRVRALGLDGREGLEPYRLADHGGDPPLARMAYRYHDHRRLADLISNPRAEAVVLRWLARERTDVLHVHHLTGFGTGCVERVAREANVPVVVSLHDYWTLCPRGQMFDVDGARVDVPEGERCGECLARTWPHLRPTPADATARTRRALESLTHARALVVPSAATAAVFRRAGVPPERLLRVEYGLDAEGLASAVERERALRPDGELRGLALGFVGSVLPSKGPLELARAVRRAKAPELRLEVHGPEPAWHGDRSYVEALRALAQIEPRVRCRGPFHPSELPRVLAGLDALAMPSLWEETYGLAAREARAAGLTVLATERGGLAGAADLVLPPDDPGSWPGVLEALAATWRAGDLRPARPGTQALHRGGQRTVERMTAEIEAVYRRVRSR